VRRFLAVVAAAAMVAGSLALRSRLDDKGSGGGSGGGSQTLRLTCADELEAACRQLERQEGGRLQVTVEPAGTTAARLARAGTGDTGLDGWLVTSPWPEIVEVERRTAALDPLFQAARPTLARSPLVLVAWKDRAAALASRCSGGVVGWKCLGEAAGTPGGWAAVGGRPEWGPVKPGHADPAASDVGALVVAQAAAAWFGRSDLSTTDLDDDGFQRWFAGLERAVPPSAGSPLLNMVVTGPSALDAAGTTEAEAGPLLARSARRGSLALLYPSPMATADVVLAAPVGDSRASSLRQVVTGARGRNALAAGGWRVPGLAPVEGVSDNPALAPGSGLPPPGLVDALRTRWHEVTGR
jgi:hypothetical protein